MRFVIILVSGLGGFLATGLFGVFAVRSRNPVWFTIASAVGLLFAALATWRTGRGLSFLRQLRDFGIAIFLAMNFLLIVIGSINPHADVTDLYGAFLGDFSESAADRGREVRRWLGERPLREAARQQRKVEGSRVSVEGGVPIAGAPGWKKLTANDRGAELYDEKSGLVWTAPIGSTFPDWSLESARTANAVCNGIAPEGTYRLATTQEFIVAKENGAFAADPRFRDSWVTLLLDEKMHLLAGGAALFGSDGGNSPSPKPVHYQARCVGHAAVEAGK